MDKIRTASSHDAGEAGRVLADGFHDDPVMSWVFQGNDDLRTTKLEVFFGFLCAEANVLLGTTFIVEGGCACWTPPPGKDEWPHDRSVRFHEILRRICDDADIDRLDVLSSAMDQFHPAEPHWYLGTIATVRRRQGEGVGTMLLRHGLAIIDAVGVPAYLESSNVRNVSLYERHGFRISGRIDLAGGPPLIPMSREPASRKFSVRSSDEHSLSGSSSPTAELSNVG